LGVTAASGVMTGVWEPLSTNHGTGLVLGKAYLKVRYSIMSMYRRTGSGPPPAAFQLRCSFWSWVAEPPFQPPFLNCSL
jgi:hypothetical protein